MKAFPVAVLAGVCGVGLLVTIPNAAAAQREVPLAAENRMHPDSTLAALHEPPGGKYRKVSALVPLPDFVPGLGTLYVRTGSLVAPVITHGLFNAVSFVYLLRGGTGGM